MLPVKELHVTDKVINIPGVRIICGSLGDGKWSLFASFMDANKAVAFLEPS
jgi:hypothetical protein